MASVMAIDESDGRGDPKPTIRFWPDWRKSNPYQELFYKSLEPHGFIAEPGLELSKQWLATNRKRTSIIHIHWPEALWRRSARNRWKQPFALIKLERFLRLARSSGIGVVWTMHNLAHHEGTSVLDSLGYRILQRNSDLMIVHSDVAASEVRKNNSHGDRLVVMPHGNYDGCYPEPASRESVLTTLGLNPNLPVVACLGRIRSYKGIGLAIAAVKALEGRVQLIIAGVARNPSDIEHFSGEIADSPYVKLIPKNLSPQEFADLSGASDLLVLPYRGITGSGALLSAWTFGRCAVASDLPFFREVASQYPGAVDLFKVGRVSSLAATIDASLSRPIEERLAAASSARTHTAWPVVIRPVADAFSALKPHMRNPQLARCE